MACPTQTTHILPSPNIPPIQLCEFTALYLMHDDRLTTQSPQPSLQPQPKPTISFHHFTSTCINSRILSPLSTKYTSSLIPSLHPSIHLSHNVTRQTHSPISNPSRIPRPAMTKMDRGSEYFYRKFIGYTPPPRASSL